jgi:hypothetical protein
MSSEDDSSLLAPARKRWWCSARRTSVTSSMMFTAITTRPSPSCTGEAFTSIHRSWPVDREMLRISTGSGESPASAARPGSRA